MNPEKEFAALADLALRAGLATTEQIALISRARTRKSVYAERHLFDLIGYLRDKVAQMSNAEIDERPLVQLVVATADAVAEAWEYERVRASSGSPGAE